MYIVNVSGAPTVDAIRDFNFSYEEVFYLQLVLFMGFGFKIPI
tara:strand:+ start:708 stop:836 length:129 start_codon:yes stop_codon:yes gene_type:complete